MEPGTCFMINLPTTVTITVQLLLPLLLLLLLILLLLLLLLLLILEFKNMTSHAQHAGAMPAVLEVSGLNFR